MDEINAKRDARMRRILENSERRLQKITGINGLNEVQGTSSQSLLVNTEMQEENFESDINGIIQDQCNRRTNSQEAFKADDIWNSVPTMSNYKYNDTSEIENATSLSNKELHSEKSYPNYDKQYKDKDHQERAEIATSSSKQTTFLPYTILSNRMNYIVLAIMVNLLLLLRLDHLFGKTIAIPYFTMMLARLYTCESAMENQDGSLLLAALILCNIKPHLAYAFKRTVNILGIIFGDLALYIFSFTLIYSGLSYFLHSDHLSV